MSDPVFTNAFKQGIVGTYSNTDTVFELDSISNTPGDPDYLADPASGEYYLVLYDGLYGNPADSNNNGAYEIVRVTGINYGANEITVDRGQLNTTAQTLGARDWQVVFSATSALWGQKADLAGNASQAFNVATATANEHAVRKEQLDEKASLSGNVSGLLSVTKTDTFSESIASNTIGSDVTGLSLDVTPKSVGSKIMIFGVVSVGGPDQTITAIHIFRDGTEIARGDAAGNRRRVHAGSTPADTRGVFPVPIHFLDEPNTDEEVTYTIRLSHNSGSTQTVYVNRSSDDSNVLQRIRAVSTITVMEVT